MAALFTFNVTTGFQQVGNTNTVSGEVSFTDNTVSYFGMNIPANQTATAYTWEFFYSTLVAFAIANGSAAQMTVVFLNGATTEATYILAPGQVCEWNTDENAANSTQYPAPFSANITSIKVTNTLAGPLYGVVVNSN